jgi:hypothetical protein
MIQVTSVVAIAAIAAGCASKQSTAGFFVTDIAIVGRTLEVQRCPIDLNYRSSPTLTAVR